MADMKDMYNSFKQMSDKYPLTESVDSYTHRPVYNGNNPINGERTFAETTSKTHYINQNRYIEPYNSRYFGSSLTSVMACEDLSFVPVNDLRIDPNKIFNSDIQAMKNLAAEQYKLKKVFEKKFLEVMNDKNKYGLTEDDITAMQALTAANTSIGNYTKEIVNIKKVATELKIKAAQAAKENNMMNGGNMQSPQSRNPYDSARTLLDGIFDAAKDVSEMTIGNDFKAPEIDPETYNDVVDVGDNIRTEAMKAKTYAIVGENNKVTEFVTADGNGDIMSDVENPSVDDVDTYDDANHTVTMMNKIQYDVGVRTDDGKIISVKQS